MNELRSNPNERNPETKIVKKSLKEIKKNKNEVHDLAEEKFKLEDLKVVVQEYIEQINFDSWMLISYQAVIVSLCAHLLMFYLYKFYTVGKIFPFYSLFPIFGIILTYLVFGEVPTILFILGGIIVITSVFFLHKIK